MTKKEIQERFTVQPMYDDRTSDEFENFKKHTERFDEFIKNPSQPCVLFEYFEPILQATHKECLEYILSEYPKSQFAKNMLKKLSN